MWASLLVANKKDPGEINISIKRKGLEFFFRVFTPEHGGLPQIYQADRLLRRVEKPSG